MNPELLKKTLNQLPKHLTQNLTKNLCVCNDVSKITIIETILKGAHTLEEIKAQTYASEGNQCCKQQIEQLIEHLVPNR